MHNVEFVPHVGRSANGQEVEFDQDFIICDGYRVGLYGPATGNVICITAPQYVPASAKRAIEEAVKAKTGESRKVAQPPTLEEDELPDDEETDDE